jgi:hypothetical protein
MYFEVIGEITDVERIAAGGSIRDLARLPKQFGSGRWRKLKGVATVRLANGRIRKVELHWYEAHGVGKRSSKSNAIWLESYEAPEIRAEICNLYPQ